MLGLSDSMEQVLLGMEPGEPKEFRDYWNPTLRALSERVYIKRVRRPGELVNAWKLTASGEIARALIQSTGKWEAA